MSQGSTCCQNFQDLFNFIVLDICLTTVQAKNIDIVLAIFKKKILFKTQKKTISIAKANMHLHKWYEYVSGCVVVW